MADLNFRVAKMPKTRAADFFLGCRDDSVFIDYKNIPGGLVQIVRISFDGYGSCELKKAPIPLSKKDSQTFRRCYSSKNVNHSEFISVVKENLRSNRKQIWKDALEEYELI